MAAAIPLVLGAVGTAATVKAASKSGGSAQVTPPPPTIDEANKNRDITDRLRRRRGVLANIFGGATASSAPAVGTKTLLGQ